MPNTMPRRKRTRVVPDSVTLVSAFLTREGPAAELLRRCRESAVVYTSEEILAEFRRTLLEKARIRRRYSYEDVDVERFAASFREIAKVVAGAADVSGAVRDPGDDIILASAASARADYIVTRDKDLLDLKTFRKTWIVSPEDFLRTLRERDSG